MQVESQFISFNNKLSHKLRQDLCIYKSSELESIFTEIINRKKTNIIIGCTYRQTKINLNELNGNYLNILLQQNSKENVFLLVDFNVDLLKYDKDDGANESINSRPCYMYLSYILHPFANIFSNYVSK